jgi:hypothetical protein
MKRNAFGEVVESIPMNAWGTKGKSGPMAAPLTYTPLPETNHCTNYQNVKENVQGGWSNPRALNPWSLDTTGIPAHE